MQSSQRGEPKLLRARRSEIGWLCKHYQRSKWMRVTTYGMATYENLISKSDKTWDGLDGLGGYIISRACRQGHIWHCICRALLGGSAQSLHQIAIWRPRCQYNIFLDFIIYSYTCTPTSKYIVKHAHQLRI